MDYSNSKAEGVHEKADENPSVMIFADASEDIREMASFASLSLGFDSKEDWEELREAPPDSKNKYASPSIPCKKPSEGFSLTPRLSEYEPSHLGSPKTEDGDLKMDLTTPHQSLSIHLDCPGRPAKGRKTSHTPSAERSSCRYLFSQESGLSVPTVFLSPIGLKGESCSKHGHYAHSSKLQPVASGFSECNSPLPSKKEDLENEFHQVMKDEPILSQEEKPIQNIGHACILESGSLSLLEAELPTPIGSPRSESSVCSDCEACMSSSGSPLSSPILSQVKLMSQTIESNASDEYEKAVVVETVVDPPESGSPAAVDTSDNIKHSLEYQLQFNMSPDMKELIDKKLSEVKSESSLVPDVALIKTEEEHHCEVIPLPTKSSSSSDQNAKASKPEVNLTFSSAGSTSSNWTAISGISPLPASDPTNLHHRHRHRHHHHHHHHTRHHHSHIHSLSRIGDFLLTSTPVHKNLVLEKVNVSSVTPAHDAEFSTMLFPEESRFVMSSELQFNDSSTQSQVSVPEAEAPGNQEGTLPLELDDSNMEDVPSSHETHFAVMQNLNEMMDVTIDIDAADNPEQICQTRKRQIGTTGNDSEKDGSEEEEDTHLPPKKMYASIISGNEVKSEFINISNPFSWHNVKEVKDSGSASWIRELSKKEAEFLLATPTNISDDIWDQLPSPRRASSVDESLFRGVSSVSEDFTLDCKPVLNMSWDKIKTELYDVSEDFTLDCKPVSVITIPEELCIEKTETFLEKEYGILTIKNEPLFS